MPVPEYDDTIRIKDLPEATSIEDGINVVLDSAQGGVNRMGYKNLMQNNLMIGDDGRFYVYVEDES